MNVEISDFQGGDKALEALVGGSADIGCGAYEHTLYMAAKGLSIKAHRAAGEFVRPCRRHPEGQGGVLSRADDLKGMKIGVTGAGLGQRRRAAHAAGKAGMTADDVSVIGVGGGAGRGRRGEDRQARRHRQLRSGDLAAAARRRDQDHSRHARKQKDLDYLYGGPFAASAFYVDARFIERNPKTMQAFVNAISAALDWLSKASTDEIVAAVPPEYYAGDRELYRAMIENNRERVSPDGRISAGGRRAAPIEISRRSRTPSRTPRSTSPKTYDNSFIERAPSLRAK